MPSTILKDTLVSQVTDELRQRIQAGEFRPGDLLPPRRLLAERFGVGLSTIHEALSALSALGMVDSKSGKGTWVREHALTTIIPPEVVAARLGRLNARMVYEARFAIEIALTELAAQRATAEDAAEIWRCVAEMEAAVDDLPAFIAADWAFHLAVARAGRNELLRQFYDLSRRLLLEIIDEMLKLPNVKEESIGLQRAIAEAIGHHDPLAARQAAEAHMESVYCWLTEWQLEARL